MRIQIILNHAPKGQSVLNFIKGAKAVSNVSLVVGLSMTAKNYNDGNISGARATFEAGLVTGGSKKFGISVYATGYFLGGSVLNSSSTYQNWKQNTWLPYRKQKLGY